MNNNFETKVTELVRSHAVALKAKSHNDRAVALEAAKHTINGECDAEAAALKRAMTSLEVTRQAQLEAAAASAETARRAHASALLGEVFASGADALPAHVGKFRAEPSRAGALAIRAAWTQFAERAQAELGEPLNTSVLGAIFVDDIIASQPQLAGSINHMSDAQFGANDAVLSALHAATKPNMTPAEVQEALTRLDAVLMRIALRHAGKSPDPENVARHALRRAHATHRDLTEATSVFDQQAGAARQAKFASEYVAPPASPYNRFRQRLVERGLLSPE